MLAPFCLPLDTTLKRVLKETRQLAQKVLNNLDFEFKRETMPIGDRVNTIKGNTALIHNTVPSNALMTETKSHYSRGIPLTKDLFRSETQRKVDPETLTISGTCFKRRVCTCV